MDTFDPAAEFLRLAERYRQMSDSELLLLVPEIAQLTPLAQQALASEVRQRGLEMKTGDEDAGASRKPAAKSVFSNDATPNSAKSARHISPPDRRFPFSSPDAELPDDQDVEELDPYEEDRELVEILKVWSMRDALEVQRRLDVAGIPFFMGPEKATGVDRVTSNFAEGVGVEIMRVGIPWARLAMQDYWPKDAPQEPRVEIGEIPVHCPKCHSTEVILQDVLSDGESSEEESSSPKYRWTCDSCGNQWEDEGVLNE